MSVKYVNVPSVDAMLIDNVALFFKTLEFYFFNSTELKKQMSIEKYNVLLELVQSYTYYVGGTTFKKCDWQGFWCVISTDQKRELVHWFNEIQRKNLYYERK